MTYLDTLSPRGLQEVHNAAQSEWLKGRIIANATKRGLAVLDMDKGTVLIAPLVRLQPSVTVH